MGQNWHVFCTVSNCGQLSGFHVSANYSRLNNKTGTYFSQDRIRGFEFYELRYRTVVRCHAHTLLILCPIASSPAVIFYPKEGESFNLLLCLACVHL